MGQQKLFTEKFGAADQRVVDFFTPLNGVEAPDVQAKFLGQMFIDTEAGDVYVSVAIDSEDPADDWKKVTPAAL
jgi:hypothetical protein